MDCRGGVACTLLTHDRLRSVLAHEAIILLGFLLLGAAVWGWGALTTTTEHFPPFQVVMLNPSTNGVLLSRSGDGPPVGLDGCAAVETGGVIAVAVSRRYRIVDGRICAMLRRG